MSGREWSKVSPEVWCSPRFLDLKSSDARLLLLYFMSNSHQNSSGCYRIPDGYAVADLGWSMEQYRKARADLVSASLISFDAGTFEVFVDRWFKHNPPTNKSHATGAMRLISKIASDQLREKAEAEFIETDWGAKTGNSNNPLDSQFDPLANGSRLTSTSFMRGSR